MGSLSVFLLFFLHYLSFSAGTLSFNTGSNGGVIYVTVDDYVYFTLCTISDNVGQNSGGVVYVVSRGSIDIRKSLVVRNYSTKGGVIDTSQSPVNITISESIFDYNKATLGGVFYSDPTSSGNISIYYYSSFSFNVATEEGGVAYTSLAITASQATFSSNNAILRGGAFSLSNSELMACNCFFLYNSTERGGAIYLSILLFLMVIFIINGFDY